MAAMDTEILRSFKKKFRNIRIELETANKVVNLSSYECNDAEKNSSDKKSEILQTLNVIHDLQNWVNDCVAKLDQLEQTIIKCKTEVLSEQMHAEYKNNINQLVRFFDNLPNCVHLDNFNKLFKNSSEPNAFTDSRSMNPPAVYSMATVSSTSLSIASSEEKFEAIGNVEEHRIILPSMTKPTKFSEFNFIPHVTRPRTQDDGFVDILKVKSKRSSASSDSNSETQSMLRKSAQRITGKKARKQLQTKNRQRKKGSQTTAAAPSAAARGTGKKHKLAASEIVLPTKAASPKKTKDVPPVTDVQSKYKNSLYFAKSKETLKKDDRVNCSAGALQGKKHSCCHGKCNCQIITETVKSVSASSQSAQVHWMQAKASQMRNRDSFNCYDMLDELTLKDLAPLRAEYPRKDYFVPPRYLKPENTFLYSVIYSKSVDAKELLQSNRFYSTAGRDCGECVQVKSQEQTFRSENELRRKRGNAFLKEKEIASIFNQTGCTYGSTVTVLPVKVPRIDYAKIKVALTLAPYIYLAKEPVLPPRNAVTLMPVKVSYDYAADKRRDGSIVDKIGPFGQGPKRCGTFCSAGSEAFPVSARAHRNCKEAAGVTAKSWAGDAAFLGSLSSPTLVRGKTAAPKNPPCSKCARNLRNAANRPLSQGNAHCFKTETSYSGKTLKSGCKSDVAASVGPVPSQKRVPKAVKVTAVNKVTVSMKGGEKVKPKLNSGSVSTKNLRGGVAEPLLTPSKRFLAPVKSSRSCNVSPMQRSILTSPRKPFATHAEAEPVFQIPLLSDSEEGERALAELKALVAGIDTATTLEAKMVQEYLNELIEIIETRLFYAAFSPDPAVEFADIGREMKDVEYIVRTYSFHSPPTIAEEEMASSGSSTDIPMENPGKTSSHAALFEKLRSIRSSSESSCCGSDSTAYDPETEAGKRHLSLRQAIKDFETNGKAFEDKFARLNAMVKGAKEEIEKIGSSAQEEPSTVVVNEEFCPKMDVEEKDADGFSEKEEVISLIDMETFPEGISQVSAENYKENCDTDAEEMSEMGEENCKEIADVFGEAAGEMCQENDGKNWESFGEVFPETSVVKVEEGDGDFCQELLQAEENAEKQTERIKNTINSAKLLYKQLVKEMELNSRETDLDSMEETSEEVAKQSNNGEETDEEHLVRASSSLDFETSKSDDEESDRGEFFNPIALQDAEIIEPEKELCEVSAQTSERLFPVAKIRNETEISVQTGKSILAIDIDRTNANKTVLLVDVDTMTSGSRELEPEKETRNAKTLKKLLQMLSEEKDDKDVVNDNYANSNAIFEAKPIENDAEIGQVVSSTSAHNVLNFLDELSTFRDDFPNVSVTLRVNLGTWEAPVQEIAAVFYQTACYHTAKLRETRKSLRKLKKSMYTKVRDEEMHPTGDFTGDVKKCESDETIGSKSELLSEICSDKSENAVSVVKSRRKEGAYNTTPSPQHRKNKDKLLLVVYSLLFAFIYAQFLIGYYKCE